MAKMYHINGDSVSPCHAQKGNCPYGKGEVENHFSDPGAAMAVLEDRLSREYASVMKGEKRAAKKTAKELAAAGADPKEIRDALREENPSWDARRVHTVQAAMTRGSSSAPSQAASQPQKKPATKITGVNLILSPKEVEDRLAGIEAAKAEEQAIIAERSRLNAATQEYDEKFGLDEGRAYYYGPGGKTYGRPVALSNGSTPRVFYDPRPEVTAQLDALTARRKAATKKAEDLQTEIEESGNGHRIPDDGNVIRVRTQAQKWMLKNNLLGQISDGKWENLPGDHWEPWSNAKVVVDPSNLGRNFSARKDNYQLNAADLLSVIGDEMQEDVRTRTGDSSYGEQRMKTDLADLRKIFKTPRQPL